MDNLNPNLMRPRKDHVWLYYILIGIKSSNIHSIITNNNFRLKPSVIQMVQQYVQFDAI